MLADNELQRSAVGRRGEPCEFQRLPGISLALLAAVVAKLGSVGNFAHL